MTAIAKGDFVAIVAASSKVKDSSRSDATKWLTTSHSLALRASGGAAVKNIRLADGNRTVGLGQPVDVHDLEPRALHLRDRRGAGRRRPVTVPSVARQLG